MGMLLSVWSMQSGAHMVVRFLCAGWALAPACGLEPAQGWGPSTVRTCRPAAAWSSDPSSTLTFVRLVACPQFASTRAIPWMHSQMFMYMRIRKHTHIRWSAEGGGWTCVTVIWRREGCMFWVPMGFSVHMPLGWLYAERAARRGACSAACLLCS